MASSSSSLPNFLIPTKAPPPRPAKYPPSQLSLSAQNKAFRLYCRPYNVQIVAEEEEDEESMIQRFRREVMRAGIIQEVRRRKHHENKQEKAKRKTQEAAKKNRRRKGPYVPYKPPGSDLEIPVEDDEPDDDYWDGYDEPLPADVIEESL